MSGYPLDEFEKKLASYYKDKKCVSYVAWDRQKNVISEELGHLSIRWMPLTSRTRLNTGTLSMLMMSNINLLA